MVTLTQWELETLSDVLEYYFSQFQDSMHGSDERQFQALVDKIDEAL